MKGAAWRKGGQPAILDFSLTDVNECLTPGVCAHGRCINLEGSFRCSCEQGYEVTLDEKGCQGTKILKHPSSTANQPVAPSLHTHTPTPGPASLTMLIQRITGQDLSFPLPLHTCQSLLSWHICPAEPHTEINGLFQMSTSVPAGPRAPRVSVSTLRAPSPAQPVTVGTG